MGELAGWSGEGTLGFGVATGVVEGWWLKRLAGVER